MANVNTTQATSGDSNLMAAACYVTQIIIPIVVPLILFFIKKDDRLVRFHALQSMLFTAVMFVIVFVLSILGTIIGIVTLGIGFILMALGFPLIGLAVLVYMLYVTYKAYKGEYYKIPMIGNFAEKHI